MPERKQWIHRAELTALTLVAFGVLGLLVYRRYTPVRARPDAQADEGRTLVVLGPANVRVEHGDRSRPCERVFRIFNPTSRPIVIRQVTTSCSCTVATRIEGTLGAGQASDLRLQVNRFDVF